MSKIPSEVFYPGSSKGGHPEQPVSQFLGAKSVIYTLRHINLIWLGFYKVVTNLKSHCPCAHGLLGYRGQEGARVGVHGGQQQAQEGPRVGVHGALQ